MRASVKGVVKPLHPSNPHNPNHPSHVRKWLDLARAMGRAAADLDYDRLQKGERNDKAKDRGDLR